MNSRAPKIADRAALQRNRTRAIASGRDAFFLHDLAIDEVKERLELVNRRFTKMAIVTGFPSIWAPHFPNAFVVSDTELLELPTDAFDLVVHAMSLHWADDPIGQIVQCKRALQPDGLFMGCLFGGQTLNELRAALAESEVQFRSGMAPRVAPMAEIRDLGSLLQRAGLGLPVADSLVQRVTYENIRSLMHDLRNMGEGNALNSRSKIGLSREILARANEIYSDNFKVTKDRIAATFEIIFLSGWSPHPDQQQPMRPGSASHSLAAVLDELKSKPG